MTVGIERRPIGSDAPGHGDTVDTRVACVRDVGESARADRAGFDSVTDLDVLICH